MSLRCFLGVVALLAVASANAGPLTGENLVVNGEFEADMTGVQQPTGWASYSANVPDWDGVTQYGSTAGHPYPNTGHEPNCYGDIAGDGASTSATIGQFVGNGNPGDVWIGGWVYTADGPGAYVKFHLDQAGTNAHWESPQMYQSIGGGAGWSWWEFLVSTADYGFGTGELTLSVELQLATGVGVGIHGMFVDGVEMESLGLSSGACCLGNACVEVASEAECLALDAGARWNGYESDCTEDANANGIADACERCVLNDPFADADGDGDVDQEDFAVFQVCYTGEADLAGVFDPIICECMDTNGDQDVDQEDLLLFEACASGPMVPADTLCDGQ